MEEVVELAAHDVAGDDFRSRFERPLERRDLLLRMILQRDLDEGLQAAVDGSRADQRGVAGNDAGFLHLLHTALAGRGRQADLLRQIHHGDAAVLAQFFKDSTVYSVEGRDWWFHLLNSTELEK